MKRPSYNTKSQYDLTNWYKYIHKEKTSSLFYFNSVSFKFKRILDIKMIFEMSNVLKDY